MTDINKNKETLKKLIEFIVTILKTELNRLSNFAQDQLQTNEIGSQIKLIIEEYFNKVVYLFEIERDFGTYFEDLLFEMLRNSKQKLDINDKSNQILQEVSELNVIYDFHQIVNNLKDLNTIDINRLLTYLVILNIKRKIEKQYILFCPFSRSCILPQKKSICSFPNSKICPEFQIKEKKLKSRL